MTVLLRSLWLLAAISIVTLTLPVRGESQPLRVSANHRCCAHMPAHHGHCGGGPADSHERQCCASCALGVSLINALPVAYIFNRSRGETLVAASADETARFARPPVPPPRA
jgi:hypothetical protein